MTDSTEIMVRRLREDQKSVSRISGLEFCASCEKLQV